MSETFIGKMVEAARDSIQDNGDGQNHTVGAAVSTRDGNIITGVNLFHFTGGPCAEIVALANAISDGEKDLTAVVAVGDRRRGVLAPCGRCRQVLFDYYPDIKVICEKDGDYITKPIKELLPNAYDWNEQQPDSEA